MTPRFLSVALATGLLALPAQSHEFWMVPPAAMPIAGGTARLSLQVGEFFEGDIVGFSAPQTAGLRQFTASGTQDLRPALPPVPVAELALPLKTAGTHLIAFESEPNRIELSADKFHAYLHDEGLDFIQKQRETAGVAEKPARERYRRYVKTLIAVKAGPGGRAGQSAPADATYSVRTGQRLEVIPLSDPLRLKPGQPWRVAVHFENQPLAGALVKAWHKRDGQTLIIRATTARDGSVVFNLPYAGTWMVSVVHMVAARGEPDVDWDSLWGNLTFVLPAATAR